MLKKFKKNSTVKVRCYTLYFGVLFMQHLVEEVKNYVDVGECSNGIHINIRIGVSAVKADKKYLRSPSFIVNWKLCIDDPGVM